MAKKPKLEVDLVDVSQEIIVKPKEGYRDGVSRVLAVLMPEKEQEKEGWRGFNFDDISIDALTKKHYGYWTRHYDEPLLGLKMNVRGPDYKTIQRRVMFKDGKIDKADFLRKYAELKATIVRTKEHEDAKTAGLQAKEKVRLQALNDAGYKVAPKRSWELPAGIHIEMETIKSGRLQLYFYSQESLTEFLKLYHKLHPPVNTTTEV